MDSISRWLEGDSIEPRSFAEILRFVSWALIFHLLWLFPATLMRIYFGIDIPVQDFDFSSRAVFFFNAVIYAPIMEEIIFRLIPLTIGAEIMWNSGAYIFSGYPESGAFLRKKFLVSALLGAITSVIFGVSHGSFGNLLYQGVGGLFLWVTLLYCSNFSRNLTRGYLGAVMLHALFNFSVCSPYFLGF